jgi:hypothetical protein
VGGRGTVTRPGGPPLTTPGNWSNRPFSVVDGAGRSVARIVNTSRFFTLRPDSFAFELRAPVLSTFRRSGWPVPARGRRVQPGGQWRAIG